MCQTYVEKKGTVNFSKRIVKAAKKNDFDIKKFNLLMPYTKGISLSIYIAEKTLKVLL